MKTKVRKVGLLAMLLFCVCVIAGQSFGSVIYSDSFESYTVGAKTPAPWDGWYTSNNFVSNAAAKTGSQCVSLQSGGSIGRDADISSIVDGKGTVTLSFKDNGWGSPGFMMYISDMDNWGVGATYTRVYVGYWGGITAYSNNNPNAGISLCSGSLIQNQNWNTISVSYDLTAGTYDVMCNGTLIGDGLALYNTPDPTSTATILRARIDDWNGANANIHTYVDDWSLSTVPEPATICLLGLGLMIFRKSRNS
ncbi:MAG: PEP-CTERM sorting domain-containing protein [Planctomycetaceae bacterium]|nr:PEP-CTERM sorting domain-containing protein [Planctomycetaceae bacterium]